MDISDFKVFVLSMPKSKKRREFMDFKMPRAGVCRYQYFDATDGKEVESEYRAYLSESSSAGAQPIPSGLPAYGCLMSHCSFIQSSPPGRYVLLEDDVYLHKHFLRLLSALPANTMNEYDMVYIGYNNYALSEAQVEGIKRGDPLLPVDKEINTFGTYGLMYGPGAISHLRGVLRRDMPARFVAAVDRILWREAANNMRSAIANPPLVIPEVRDSTIRTSRDMQEFCRERKFNMSDYACVEDYERFLA